MFGFLKQKIADFGNKLKDTVSKEEEKQKKDAPKQAEEKKEEIKQKEKEKIEEKKTDSLEKKETSAAEKKPQAKTEAQKEHVKKAEHKSEDKKEKETHKKEKKKGLLGILFGGKKKEKEEKKKKTKEEAVSELEGRMFKDIEAELKEEEKQTEQKETATPSEIDLGLTEEEIRITKKTDEVAEGLEVENEEEEQKEEPAEEKTAVKGNTENYEELAEVEEKQKFTHEEEKKVRPSIELEDGRIPSEKEDEEKNEEEEIFEDIEEQEERKEKSRDIKIKTLEEDKRELHANVGVGGKLKGFIFGGIELSEKDVNDLIWELELSLIESDVEQDAASEIASQIKKRLVGKKVSAKNIDDFLKEQIKEILAEMMKTDKIDVLAMAKKHKPFKILILGPNGAGKTTSIAKLTHYFQKHKMSCILAAGDTFRAGAIDQIEEHAKKLKVRLIKQQYGADPAAVAFDAIKAAEAGKIDVVIMDSAGRQETNKNLMEELRKLERVAKPDLKIYVGEAYVGQGLLEQAEEFKEMIGIDGFILTKIDTDAKGGTAISLVYKMKKPILFVGTGQGYDDLEEFTPEFILERII